MNPAAVSLSRSACVCCGQALGRILAVSGSLYGDDAFDRLRTCWLGGGPTGASFPYFQCPGCSTLNVRSFPDEAVLMQLDAS